ncbi:hypothetical protein [Agrobacterium fabrum]|uniref:hypothetical protein n=1 Tax=Agrobacterium fabrum TaxID=1176649 RepID=UPI00215863B4|nr:hypothetical protein [Agrobacterium fabrum]MCR6727856.1 hypothetical protein [Agrobacterium fabrum]
MSTPQERMIGWSGCPKHEGAQRRTIIRSVLFGEVAAASIYRPESRAGLAPHHRERGV